MWTATDESSILSDLCGVTHWCSLVIFLSICLWDVFFYALAKFILAEKKMSSATVPSFRSLPLLSPDLRGCRVLTAFFKTMFFLPPLQIHIVSLAHLSKLSVCLMVQDLPLLVVVTDPGPHQLTTSSLTTSINCHHHPETKCQSPPT